MIWSKLLQFVSHQTGRTIMEWRNNFVSLSTVWQLVEWFSNDYFLLRYLKYVLHYAREFSTDTTDCTYSALVFITAMFYSSYFYCEKKRSLVRAIRAYIEDRSRATFNLSHGARCKWMTYLSPENSPGTRWIENWVGPRAGLDVSEKQNPLVPVKSFFFLHSLLLCTLDCLAFCLVPVLTTHHTNIREFGGIFFILLFSHCALLVPVSAFWLSYILPFVSTVQHTQQKHPCSRRDFFCILWYSVVLHPYLFLSRLPCIFPFNVTYNTQRKHPCPRRDSNPQPQQAICRSPSP